MSFFDFFKTKTNEEERTLSQLYYDLSTILKEQSEEEHIKTSCFAGLLARLAHLDWKVCELEKDFMLNTLMNKSSIGREQAEAVVEIALKNIEELGGLDNHLYVHPLRSLLTEDEKYSLICNLFALAGADGVVGNDESEEIRIITKGLDLSSQHFLAARATVINKLGALKKE